jgi:hypothetical protein
MFVHGFTDYALNAEALYATTYAFKEPLLKSVCDTWTPVLGVKQSDVTRDRHRIIPEHMCRVGQNHICTVCICFFGRETTKYTVIYGVCIRFWPTLYMCYNCLYRHPQYMKFLIPPAKNQEYRFGAIKSKIGIFEAFCCPNRKGIINVWLIQPR